MSDSKDVSVWIQAFKSGEEGAASQIFYEYFPKLATLARNTLGGRNNGRNDDEDLALSALKSFFNRAQHFPQLEDRDDLWRLLATITVRKAFRENRRERKYAKSDVEDWLEQLVSTEPTPSEAVAAVDFCDFLLGQITDAQIRKAVLLRLDGATQEKIASCVGLSCASVSRKLKSVRQQWLQLLED